VSKSNDGETRYWRIQMDCGPMATGRIHAHLRDYVIECVQKGVGFQVTWWDSMDEAYAGVHAGGNPDIREAFEDAHRAQEEVDGILRSREAERNRQEMAP